MEEKSKRKQIAKISVFITSLFVIFLSVGYAFINQTLTGTKRQVITAGNLELELLEDENNLTIQDALPMYDEVGMLQDAFTFRLINKTNQDTNYIMKLVDITTGQRLDASIVKYELTKDEVSTIAKISDLEDFQIDTGTIQGNQINNYSLRLWIDSSVEDESLISGKSLSYRIDIEAVQDTTIANSGNGVSEKLFYDENLGDSCKTYNDGVDTFLVGQCQNNYVWYSGKLWRVVLKNNETSAVKLVTDNAITAISYNESGNSNFENSYVDQWLNQEFLSTLHNYQEYLVVDSVWDATLDSSDTPTRPKGTTTVNRTVGLLNVYEYYTTYNNSDSLAANTTGYLNNGVLWWTMTPYNASSVRNVNWNGNLGYSTFSYADGVRPSINMKSSIQIISGNGTISNPYKLIGDEQETVNGSTLLSTRYSGEYVKFNNELYRIVDIENALTKITAVDKPTELLNNEFDSENNANFENSSIKADLEKYYQNSIIESYKSMIEPNTNWYLGMVGEATNYKASICTVVDTNISSKACEKTTETATASIGLLRVGEIFSSQITRGTKASFWTLTPLSSIEERGMLMNNTLSVNDCGARPSMYLKSSVRIASNNTGNGTYESPYDIELVV